MGTVKMIEAILLVADLLIGANVVRIVLSLI
jgi:hypothetical protein